MDGVQLQNLEDFFFHREKQVCNPWAEKTLRGIFSSSTHQWIAHLSHGTIAAFVIYQVWEDGLEIYHLETHAKYRRKGLMLTLLNQLFVDHGKRQVWLDVSSHNVAAQGLYRRLKFQKTGIRKNYYSPGEHALLLTRRPEGVKRPELS